MAVQSEHWHWRPADVGGCARVLSHADEARRFTVRALAVRPDLRIATRKDVHPFRRPQDTQGWIDGLRASGIPE